MIGKNVSLIFLLEVKSSLGIIHSLFYYNSKIVDGTPRYDFRYTWLPPNWEFEKMVFNFNFFVPLDEFYTLLKYD